MSDTKIWVETILPEPIPDRTQWHGDDLHGRTVFSTSDYGDGAVDMQKKKHICSAVVCLNGMVRESLMKQVHLGTRLPDNLQLSERTYAL